MVQGAHRRDETYAIAQLLLLPEPIPEMVCSFDDVHVLSCGYDAEM